MGICFSLTSFLTEMWKLFCSSGRHHEHEERSARHSFFSTTYPCIWNWCGKFGLAEKNLTSRTLLEDPHFLSDWFTTQQLNWQLPYRSKLKVRYGQKICLILKNLNKNLKKMWKKFVKLIDFTQILRFWRENLAFLLRLCVCSTLGSWSLFEKKLNWFISKSSKNL